MSLLGKIGALVGAVVGVALVATGVGAPLGGALLGAAIGIPTALGAALTYGAIGFVAGTVLDYALGAVVPDIPSPTYDGTFPVPILESGAIISEAYGGPLYIAGNILRMNDPDAEDKLKIIVGHCLGPVEEFLGTYVNKKEWNTLDKVHHMVHSYGEEYQVPIKITTSIAIDQPYSSKTLFGMLTLVVNAYKSLSVVDNFFTDKICSFRGLAHSAYLFDKSSSDIGTNTPSVVEVIKGRRLIPIALNGVEGELEWSRNIGDILWDYYRRYDVASIIDEQQIGFWAFNESIGSIAVDSSKYDNNGTLHNFTGTYWVEGQFGNGLQFNGSNSYVDCGNLIPLSLIGKQSFSLSFMISFDSVTGIIWQKYEDSSNYIKVFISGGYLKIEAKSLGSYIINESFNFYPIANIEYRIVLCFDKTNLVCSLYVNKLKDTIEVGWNTDTDISNTGNVFWGSTSSSFAGVLDQARIYNKVLDFREVFACYEDGILDENSFRSLKEYSDEFLEDSEGSPMRPIGPSNYTVIASSQFGQTINRNNIASIATKLFAIIGEPRKSLIVTGTSPVTHTSDYGIYSPIYAFDVTKSLTSAPENNSWRSGNFSYFIASRISCDLSLPVKLRKVEIIPEADIGLKTFYVQGSNSVLDFLQYEYNDIGTTWTVLGSLQTAVPYDSTNPVQKFYINSDVAYRYYSLKIMSSYGITTGIRDICFWGIHPRFPFDHVFDNNIRKNDVKKLLNSCFFGRTFRTQGKIKVGWEGNKEPDGLGSLQDKSVKHIFTLNNVISLTRKKHTRYNKIKINYINFTEEGKKDYIEDSDEIDIEKRGEQLFEESCDFIYHQQIARARARRHLKKSMYCDWDCVIESTDEANRVELFDVISVIWSKFGWNEKQFIVMKKTEDWLGRVTFYCEAYYSGIYDDEETPVPESYFSKLSKVLGTPSPVTNLQALDDSYFDEQGSYITQVEISYTPPNNRNYFSHIKYQYGFKLTGENLITSGESPVVYMQPSYYANINVGDILFVSGEEVTVGEKLGDSSSVLVGKSLLLSGEVFSSDYVSFFDYPGKDTGVGYFTLDGRNMNLEIGDDLYVKAISVNTFGIESGLFSPYTSLYKGEVTLLGLQEALASGKKRILLPDGIYSGEFTLPDQDVIIEGVSKSGVIFTNMPSQNLFILHNLNSNYAFKNFTLQSNVDGTYPKLFNITGDTEAQNLANISFDNLSFIGKASRRDRAIYGYKGKGNIAITNCHSISGEINFVDYTTSKFNISKNIMESNIFYAFQIYCDTINMEENQCLNYTGVGMLIYPTNTANVNKNYLYTRTGCASITGINIFTTTGDIKAVQNKIDLDTSSYSNSSTNTGLKISNDSTGISFISDNNINLKAHSNSATKGLYFYSSTGIGGSVIGNTVVVNNINTPSDNNLGIELLSNNATITGNSINLVNNSAKDIGISLHAAYGYNKGTDNITYNVGTSILDAGTSNDVLAKDV